MTFHFCPGESYWTTPRRGMLCLCPCWSPWEKTSWLMLTATISGSLSYQVGSCWVCVCVMYNRMWPCLVCSCQPEVQCFPPATTSRSWRQLRAENITPRCFTPVPRSAFFWHLGVKKICLIIIRCFRSHRCLLFQVMTLIQDLPVPVIAMVNGVATAAGCQLVASCDVAVVTEKSTFATPGVNVGLFCSTPAVAIGRAVPRKVRSWAKKGNKNQQFNYCSYCCVNHSKNDTSVCFKKIF